MLKLAAKPHKIFVLDFWTIAYVQVRQLASVHFHRLTEVLKTAMAHLVARNQKL